MAWHKPMPCVTKSDNHKVQGNVFMLSSSLSLKRKAENCRQITNIRRSQKEEEEGVNMEYMGEYASRSQRKIVTNNEKVIYDNSKDSRNDASQLR